MAVLVWALLWAGCSYAEASLYRNLTEELQAFFHQSMERSWNLPDENVLPDWDCQFTKVIEFNGEYEDEQDIGSVDFPAWLARIRADIPMLANRVAVYDDEFNILFEKLHRNYPEMAVLEAATRVAHRNLTMTVHQCPMGFLFFLALQYISCVIKDAIRIVKEISSRKQKGDIARAQGGDIENENLRSSLFEEGESEVIEDDVGGVIPNLSDIVQDESIYREWDLCQDPKRMIRWVVNFNSITEFIPFAYTKWPFVQILTDSRYWSKNPFRFKDIYEDPSVNCINHEIVRRNEIKVVDGVAYYELQNKTHAQKLQQVQGEEESDEQQNFETSVDTFRKIFNNAARASSHPEFWDGDWSMGSMRFVFDGGGLVWHTAAKICYWGIGMARLWEAYVGILSEPRNVQTSIDFANDMWQRGLAFSPEDDFFYKKTEEEEEEEKRKASTEGHGEADTAGKEEVFEGSSNNGKGPATGDLVHEGTTVLIRNPPECNLDCLFASQWPLGAFLWLVIGTNTLKHDYTVDFEETYLFGPIDSPVKQKLLQNFKRFMPKQLRGPDKEVPERKMEAADTKTASRTSNWQRATSEFFSRYLFPVNVSTEESSEDREFVKQRASTVDTIYVTMVWGKKYAAYLDAYCRHMNELGIGAGDSSFDEYLVFVHDMKALTACVESVACNSAHSKTTTNALFGGRCVRGISRELGKFSLGLVLLQYGYDIVYVDFDTYLLKNPTSFLKEQAIKLGEAERIGAQSAETKDKIAAQAAEPLDILVGGSIFDDCINNGFFYVRSSFKTREWLSSFFMYLQSHPYLVDQKVFSAFLGDNARFERVPEWVPTDADAYLTLASELRWAPLDPYRYWAHSYWYDEKPPTSDRAGRPHPRLYAFHFENAGWLPPDFKLQSKKYYHEYADKVGNGTADTKAEVVVGEEKDEGVEEEDEESAKPQDAPPDEPVVDEFELFYGLGSNATVHTDRVLQHIWTRKLENLPSAIKRCKTLPQNLSDISSMIKPVTYPGVIPDVYLDLWHD